MFEQYNCNNCWQIIVVMKLIHKFHQKRVTHVSAKLKGNQKE